MKSRLIMLATAILAMALLAGCGELSKSEYVKEVNKISSKADKQFSKLDKGEADDGDIKAITKALDSMADDLDALKAPSEVKDLHKDLVQTLRDGSDLVDEAGDIGIFEDPSKIDPKKMEEFQKHAAAFEKDSKRIESGFKKKKYSIKLGD